MTTPHPIGELLRAGVRPTDEETEHLRGLGSFVAEMYGRYLDGRAPALLESGSDAWAKRFSGRLAASTAERWQAGLGLSELLLDGMSSWWQLSQDGFATGYGDLDAEMQVLSLFDEEPQVTPEAEHVAAPRRRRSLFGEKPARSSQTRRPQRRAAPVGAAEPSVGRSLASSTRDASAPRAGRWGDGSIAELAVLRALAAGGLQVADQVSEVLDAVVGAGHPGAGTLDAAALGTLHGEPRSADGTASNWRTRVATKPLAIAAHAALAQANAGFGPQGLVRRLGHSVNLDGMRIDDRTPALATALERVRAVFGANVAGSGPALNAGRLDALTSAVKVSIDRGLGEGERPVYGFYDAVESTFLSLAKDASPEASAASNDVDGETQRGVGRRSAVRAARTVPVPNSRDRAAASAGAVRRFAPGLAVRAGDDAQQRGESAGRGPAVRHVSLDEVVQAASPREVRPFTGGVFASPGRAPRSLDFADRIAFAPSARPVAHVQRGAVSAPRMSVTTVAGEVLSPRDNLVGAASAGGIQALSAMRGGYISPAAATAAHAQGGGALSSASLFSALATEGRALSGWRLAADGGADLPIGASFGRAEVFGATRQIDARNDMRTLGREFRPVIARSAEDAMGRPNRLADAVDGLVWVSAPLTASDASAIGQVADVQLSAVPSGRRAAMVPAGAAFAAITRAAAGQTARGLSGDVRPALRVANSGYANVFDLLRSGVVARTGVASRRDEARREAVAGRDVLSSLQARLSASEALSAATIGRTTSAVGVLSTAQQGIAAAQPLADKSASASALNPRWLDAVLADSSTVTALRASRWLEDVIVQGGYGRVDDLRVMLAMAKVAGPVEAESASAGDAPGATARSFQRMSRFAAQPSAAVPQVGAQARGAAAALRDTSRPVGDQVKVQNAREARQALLRPVMTARETRAAAGALGPQGVSALSGSAPVAGFASTAMRLAMSDARSGGAAGVRSAQAGSSNQPVLSRLVAAAHTDRAVGAASARWDMDGGLVERLGRLGSGEQARVIQMLSTAGWTSSELALLDLARPSVQGAGQADAGQVGPAVLAQRAGIAALAGDAVRGVASARTAEAAPEASRVGRMGQSIARVMSGTEALGGNVDEAVSGAQAQAIARAQAAAWLPLLGSGASDKYFGAMAPTTAGASRSAFASLGDAIGELVKMAEVAAAQSDSVVATEAQRETLRRVLAARGGVVEAASLATALGPRGGAALASLAQRAAIEGMRVARPSTGTMALRAAGASGASAPIGERASAAALVSERETVRGAMLAGGVDAALVERAMQRAGLDIGSVASAGRLGVGMTERFLELPEAERTVVGLAGGAQQVAGPESSTPEGVAMRRSARGGVEQRLARALALSTAGPAGARRLTRALVGASPSKIEERAVGRTRREAQARAEQGAAAAEPVRRTALTSASLRNVGLEAAAVGEEMRHALPVGLSQALAPEVMLAGLRSPELARAVKAITQRQSIGGWDAVGVFATLSDAGIDLGSSRTSLAAESRGRDANGPAFGREDIGALLQRQAEAPAGGADVAAQLAAMGRVSPRVAAMMREASSAGGSSQAALLEVLAGGDAGTAMARAGLSKKQRAGLLSAVLRGTERAERSSLLEAAGGSDFAFAWLARVDGSKSGLDIGLGETRNEFGRTFGKRRDSSLAGASPMDGASLVAGAAPAASERGGLRSVGASVAGGLGGAANGAGQHGASDSMRRTDWRFVETGSRASTSHADLGKLAAAIVGNSESGKRAPMPLVAPAAKAIAQTALRKSASEATTKAGGGGGGGAKKGAAGPEPKLSEKAIDALAVEMANRVARLMGLMKERIGVW